jgi:CSLREA domain-containing protein
MRTLNRVSLRAAVVRVVVIGFLVSIASGGSSPQRAFAASLVVNSTGDEADDVPWDGICAIPKSNLCTLRAAIQQANASAGPDVITFSLGTATISPASQLPMLTDDAGVTIRGNGSITLDGSLIAGDPTGIFIQNSSGNRVQGLTIRNFFTGIVISGGLFDVASNNLIGTNADGSEDVQERNIIQFNRSVGIVVMKVGAHHNVIAGNFIGTNAAGNQAAPNGGGIVIGSLAGYNRIGTNGDGVNDLAERNVISGNTWNAITITNAGYAVIAGNIIGLRANGTAALGNGSGIVIGQSNLDRIGTDGNGIGDVEERNIISANTGGAGITLGNATNIVIAGNYIGTNISGTGSFGNYEGVYITDAASSGIMVGGDTPGEGNLIANNEQRGVGILGSSWSSPNSINNSILSNRIFNNGWLGIDLHGMVLSNADGVAPNDIGDVDDGPNNMVNYPVIQTAVTGGGMTTISAQIVQGLPGTFFQIQYFSNPDCDPAGYGEGQVFLGGTTVLTDLSGNATFSVTLPVSVTVGQDITATATDPDGSTSEFSQCVAVTAG